MPKNLFQDMVKAKNPKREIREQVIPQREIPRYSDIRGVAMGQAPKSRAQYGLWLVAIVSIIFFIFALSFLFARAEVIINPKIQDIVLNENLSAVKDLNMNGLSFDLVIISGEEVKKVVATETKEVAFASKGTVFLYNTSTISQNIGMNTKLEGSNGKIYKTLSSVVVPAMEEDSTPGKVEVDIVGIEAGAEYNSDPLDFKIFSFKGTSKDSKFYGRSKGSITGGFKGISPVIADAEKENAFVELRAGLKDKLFKKATEQIPDGFILFKDAAFLTIDEENVEFTSTDTSLPVKMKGTLYGFLFSEKNLTQKIAKDNITNYDDAEVYIPNIKDLVFSMPSEGISFKDVQNINFNLSGTAKIVWKFDDTKFATELIGKSKKDFNQTLSQYTNVESAQLILSPFWIRTLPDKLKDIKITVNYPK